MVGDRDPGHSDLDGDFHLLTPFLGGGVDALWTSGTYLAVVCLRSGC